MFLYLIIHSLSTARILTEGIFTAWHAVTHLNILLLNIAEDVLKEFPDTDFVDVTLKDQG